MEKVERKEDTSIEKKRIGEKLEEYVIRYKTNI